MKHFYRVSLFATFFIVGVQAQGAFSYIDSFERIDIRGISKRVSWNVLVYMAADNSLNSFSEKDIKEMERVGSNGDLNILVLLDGLGAGARTRLLYITKGKTYEVSSYDTKLDFGSSDTLISFCNWAYDNYPSDHTMLVLWNHGAGVLDPAQGRYFNANDLFKVDPISGLWEVDRSINFVEHIRRGVCFSDTYKTCLTNKKLEDALDVTTKHMGKKFDIIAFDACLMSMVEIAEYLRYYADYMVASEEVEPGEGYFYDTILGKLDSRITPKAFACHIVDSYRLGYTSSTRDFTHSAIDLKYMSDFLTLLDQFSTLVLKAMKVQVGGSVERVFTHCIDAYHCTHFAEPNYVDVGHFLKNFKAAFSAIQLQPGNASLLLQLKRVLGDTLDAYERVIIANVKGSGQNVSLSTGLSIYYPQSYLGASYVETHFYKDNAWGQILNHFFLN